MKRLSFLFFFTVAPLAHAGWEQNGQLQISQREFYVKPIKRPEIYQTSNWNLELTPELQWAGESARFKAKGILSKDQSFTVPRDQNSGQLQEFFFEKRAQNFGVLVGVNTTTWGITDVVNPLDVVNPRNFRNPLSATKMGSPEIALNWSGDSNALELIYIPVNAKPILPPASSRYLPRDVSVSNFVSENRADPTIVNPPAQALRFQYLSEVDFDQAFKNNWGLRWKTNYRNMEAQIIYFEGAPQFPEIKIAETSTIVTQLPPPITVVDLQPDIQLVAQYQRIRTAGAGVSFTRNAWIYKLVHSQIWATSRDLVIALPQTTVLGIERSLNLFKQDCNFLLQIVAQTDASVKKKSAYSTQEIFDQSLSLGFRTSNSDLSWSTLTGALVNLKGRGRVISFDVTKKFDDHKSFNFQVQDMSGPEGGLLNSLNVASSASLGLKVIW